LLGDQEVEPTVAVEISLPLHPGRDCRFDVLDRELQLTLCGGEDRAGVLGGLEWARYHCGLEEPDDCGALDQGVVPGLHGCLSVPGTPAQSVLLLPSLVEQAEQGRTVPGASAGRGDPGVDVGWRDALPGQLQAAYLRRRPSEPGGQVLAFESGMFSQFSQSAANRLEVFGAREEWHISPLRRGSPAPARRGHGLASVRR
jgi:hypothetical protein